MLDFEDNPLFFDAPVAYSVVDASGTQVSANRKFWELFGLEPDSDLLVSDITADDFRESTEHYLEALIRGEQESVVVEKGYVRADGSTFRGRLTAQRLIVADGPLLLLGVIEDIEEQHQLDLKLRAMASEQSEFVARVSHELRNPLHTIAGLAELLSSSETNQQAKRQAEIILREAMSLTAIVNDLLDIGRFDTGNLALDNDVFAIRAVIDRSARSMQSLAQKKDLLVDTNIDDGVPIYAFGDAGRVGQVVDNLCGNAIKFTMVGSVKLDVRSANDDFVEFRVTDTGPGIPPERRAEIFEPFQRLNASAHGAGLGLAISARLATSMGGSLTLEESSHDGSTFVLSVPLPEREPPARTIVTPRTSDAVTTAQVLVVEDNPETQMLASAQLTRLGYDHEIVGDGYEALALTERTKFDVILMDWHLPGIDGLETTRRIRQRESREGLERTPIISVTARAMASDIEACKEAGADDFIAKPASIAKVASVLELWTGPPAGEETGGAVDADVFSTLMDELDNSELVLSIARTFLDELPRRVTSIADCDADAESAELAAHTLKSTSAMLGAHGLRDVAKEIEEAARAGARPDLLTVNRLELVAKETDLAVRELIEKLERAS